MKNWKLETGNWKLETGNWKRETVSMPKYTLRINGRTHEVEGEAADSLLAVLRGDLGLTGSKFGCGEGHCGACTVLLGDQSVRSCTTRLVAAATRPITTIEGIADGDRLHPVQQAFLEAEAFQCGYCTPGMVVATVALLKANPNPSEQDIAKMLDRNVCRCGTYPRIVQAIKLAAERVKTRTLVRGAERDVGVPASDELGGVQGTPPFRNEARR
jgi:nicotinate dehydrogenase subunit A